MIQDMLDVAIIGAGQAGLAMGYYLTQQQLRFVILDAAPEVGYSWRTRYDSLVLFTPARFSGLPGLPFPAPPDHYPSKDEVADYLQQYAEQFQLPVSLNSRVLKVRQAVRGYEVMTDTASYTARQVVVASGPFQTPFIPPVATKLDPSIYQLHSSAYRNPSQLPPREVLVVGLGNSGAQIAAELAQTRKVHISASQPPVHLPQTILGKSLFWWLDKLQLDRVPQNTWLGRRMQQTEPVIGTTLAQLVQENKVELLGRAVDAQAHTVRFADGRSLSVPAVVWATGYRSNYSWVQAPVLDNKGDPVHQRGVTAAPGFYFLGLPWQYRFNSATLPGIGRDAAFIAEQILNTAT